MTGIAREKHIRANRRSHSRSSRPDTDYSAAHSKNRSSIPPDSTPEPGLEPADSAQIPIPIPAPSQTSSSEQNPTPRPNASPNLDDSNTCTEEQFEVLLRKDVQFYYKEALTKLCALGYDEDVALSAMLRNGNCFGGMDMLTNILNNTLGYLNSGGAENGGASGGDGASSAESELGFSDLKQLEEYSLAGMVCLLQQMRPNLSRGDAMLCLLMSDLHVGRASTIEIPVVQSPNEGLGPVGDKSNAESGPNDAAACFSAPALGFLGGLGSCNGGNDYVEAVSGLRDVAGMTMQKDIECPKRFNLSPLMKSLLTRNVPMFAAGFRANAKTLRGQAPFSQNKSPSGGASVVSREKAVVEKNADSKNTKNQEDLHSMMRKFLDMGIGANVDENPEAAEEERKDEIILILLHQIKKREKKVKEGEEWAQQRAMQAARKLSSDMTELKSLRMEMDETKRLKKGKQTLEETIMKKRLSDMEGALNKARYQVDRANAAARRLETENAEIRAEMEASKLSASESVSSCLEVAKREKRSLKKLLAWEKQKTKMQEDIAEEKRKISDLQQQLVQINLASEEAEVKWKQAKKEKELAQAQVEEERRLKEAAEASSKRKLESLRLKIEIDFQRQKDDIKRLEQELSRLKMSASTQSADVHHGSHDSPAAKSEGGKPEGETITRLLHQLELEDSPEVNRDRQCIVCMKDEVSVVFLPCAHQVICANCSDSYWGKGKTTCPCCRVPIEQKIRVFGASS